MNRIDPPVLERVKAAQIIIEIAASLKDEAITLAEYANQALAPVLSDDAHRCEIAPSTINELADLPPLFGVLYVQFKGIDEVLRAIKNTLDRLEL